MKKQREKTQIINNISGKKRRHYYRYHENKIIKNILSKFVINLKI